MKQPIRITANNKIMGFQAFMHRRGYKPKTLSLDTDFIILFLEWLNREKILMQECSHADVMSYTTYLQGQGNNIKYVNQQIVAIRHIYDYLLYKGTVKDNPAKGIHLRGETKNTFLETIEPETLRQLYETASASTNIGKRNKVMLGLLCFQGISTPELTRLKPQHINLLSCSVSIPAVNKNKPRTLLLEAVQINLLIDYLEQTRPLMLKLRKKHCDKLFFGSGGSNKSDMMITHFLKGIRRNNPAIKSLYQIRASVIAHWLTKSDLLIVQKQAGLRSPSSVERFEMQNRKQLKEKLDKVFPLSF